MGFVALAFGLGFAMAIAQPALPASAPAAAGAPGHYAKPAPTFETNPRLPDAKPRQVTRHVFVIQGMPNVGFIVGDRHILVVDTGLGPRNGALVARAAAGLAVRGQDIVLTRTHLHPQHSSGEGGFPAGVTVIRPRVQQDEMNAEEAGWLERFSARDAVYASLLKGVKVTQATELFDAQKELDLGGVRVELLYFGPAHTRGDEIVFVREDKLVLPGDVVQDRIVPNIICSTCGPRQWLHVLDKVANLHPEHIIPDHGNLGGPELLGQEREFLTDLISGTDDIRREAPPNEGNIQKLKAVLTQKYRDWLQPNHIDQDIARALAEH